MRKSITFHNGSTAMLMNCEPLSEFKHKTSINRTESGLTLTQSVFQLLSSSSFLCFLLHPVWFCFYFQTITRLDENWFDWEQNEAKTQGQSTNYRNVSLKIGSDFFSFNRLACVSKFERSDEFWFLMVLQTMKTRLTVTLKHAGVFRTQRWDWEGSA